MPTSHSDRVKPLTMSEEQEAALRAMAQRHEERYPGEGIVSAADALRAWAEVDALRTKLAETEAWLDANKLAAGEAVAEYAELQVTLAASQARERELREALDELLTVAAWRGDDVLPQPEDDPVLWTARMQTAWEEAREALAAPTSDTALRGLMRAAWKDGKSAAKECPDDDLGPACEEYIDKVLGPGAAPAESDPK